MDDQDKGKFQNCIIDFCGRTFSKPIIFQREDGTIVANLDGWALLPKDEYEKLKQGRPIMGKLQMTDPFDLARAVVLIADSDPRLPANVERHDIDRLRSIETDELVRLARYVIHKELEQ